MKNRVLYHTTENRDNPDYVEHNAPFKCTHDAWLGEGYYFWEEFIENAHWWGRTHYKDNYFICRTSCDLDSLNILDFENTQTIHEIRNAINKIQKESGIRKLTPRAVIDFFKQKGIVEFDAVRIRALGTVGDKYGHDIKARRLHFEHRTAYVDLCPPIQICIMDKCLLTSPLKIIYPEEYCESWCI